MLAMSQTEWGLAQVYVTREFAIVHPDSVQYLCMNSKVWCDSKIPPGMPK